MSCLERSTEQLHTVLALSDPKNGPSTTYCLLWKQTSSKPMNIAFSRRWPLSHWLENGAKIFVFHLPSLFLCSFDKRSSNGHCKVSCAHTLSLLQPCWLSVSTRTGTLFVLSRNRNRQGHSLKFFRPLISALNKVKLINLRSFIPLPNESQGEEVLLGGVRTTCIIICIEPDAWCGGR